MIIKDINLNAIVDRVGKEKNINKEVLISAIEAAMLAVAKKQYGLDADLEVRYNKNIGEIEVFQFRQIVKDVSNNITQISFNEAKRMDPGLNDNAVGEDLGIKLSLDNFGRIAAQNAKQVILQRMYEAERFIIFNEYKDRKHELITGVARRLEKGNIIVDLGRAEGVLPIKEQIIKENIRIGDMVTAYVLDVFEVSKGEQIVLSRVHCNFIYKLFAQEVPEINDGIVIIENVARQPGFRSKIAVRSIDNDVDPVGTCVGIKGSRVQAVIQELKGEKIDIIAFNSDPTVFVCNALLPAEINQVLLNEDERKMDLVVPDEQISLAIGKRGQNVQLATDLTGWNINIHAETKILQERDIIFSRFKKIKYLSDVDIQTLYNHGLKTVEALSVLSIPYIASLPGLNVDKAELIIKHAKKVVIDNEIELSKTKAIYRREAKILFLIDNLINNISIDANLYIKNVNFLNDIEKKYILDFGYDTLIDIYFDINNLYCNSKTNISLETLQKLKNMLLSQINYH